MDGAVSAVDLTPYRMPSPDAAGPGAAKDADNPRTHSSGVDWKPEFRALYEEHFSMAWRGLLRLGVPETSVEDAVQDVFVVVHRREGDFAARSSVKTWIYGIVVRVAKDYRRSAARQRRRLTEVERLSEVSVEIPTSPAEHAEQREAAHLVNRVLSQMNDPEREVLVLAELLDLSTKEAAEVLGASLRTTQRLLARARENFERLLNEMTSEREQRWRDDGATP